VRAAFLGDKQAVHLSGNHYRTRLRQCLHRDATFGAPLKNLARRVDSD
jgi:hypothetical protein